MKANVETHEPVIRPVAAKSATKLVRSTLRTPGFIAARAEAPLFHAWRA